MRVAGVRVPAVGVDDAGFDEVAAGEELGVLRHPGPDVYELTDALCGKVFGGSTLKAAASARCGAHLRVQPRYLGGGPLVTAMVVVPSEEAVVDACWSRNVLAYLGGRVFSACGRIGQGSLPHLIGVPEIGIDGGVSDGRASDMWARLWLSGHTPAERGRPWTPEPKSGASVGSTVVSRTGRHSVLELLHGACALIGASRRGIC